MEVRMKAKSQKVGIDKLRPNPWNPNKQSEFIYGKEKQSILEFGFVDPVTVREQMDPDGKFFEIVDGEHRWRAAVDLGMTEIEIVNLGPIEDAVAKKLTIVLNEIKGQADPSLMFDLVADLKAMDVDVSVLPFNEEELQAMSDHAGDWDQYTDPDHKMTEKGERDWTCPECGVLLRMKDGRLTHADKSHKSSGD